MKSSHRSLQIENSVFFHPEPGFSRSSWQKMAVSGKPLLIAHCAIQVSHHAILADFAILSIGIFTGV
jgi:hypothetical protein